MGISACRNSTTTCAYDYHSKVNKDCFNANNFDIDYAEHTQYISSLFLIVFLDIMIMEVKQ